MFLDTWFEWICFPIKLTSIYGLLKMTDRALDLHTCIILPQTTSVLECQWTATNYALRKRLHEMEQAQNELEWQKKNVSNYSVCADLRGLHLHTCISYCVVVMWSPIKYSLPLTHSKPTHMVTQFPVRTLRFRS